MNKPFLTLTFSALIGIVCAEVITENKFNFNLLKQAKTLAQADSIHTDWKAKRKQLPDRFWDGPVIRKIKEDHYEAWRQNAINALDDQGFLRWEGLPTPMPPSLSTPSPAAGGAITTASWQAIGPFTFDAALNTGYNPGVGRLQCMTEDPNDSKILYVGTPAGGMWKSTDAGTTWNLLMKDVSNFGVASIAVSPSNSNIVLVASGEGDNMGAPYGTGIYRSTDGGATWTNVKSYSAVGKRIVFHPQNPNKVMAATSSGLYVSTDAGLTWTQQTGPSNIEDAEWHPANEDIIYYSVPSSTSTVQKYSISAKTSTQITGFASSDHIRLATSKAAPNNLYILGSKGDVLSGFWVWNNGTITRSYNAKNVLGYDNTGAFSSTGFAWYAMAFNISQTDSNLISAGSPLIWHSSDGGKTFNHAGYRWSDWQHTAYNHPDMHDVQYFGNRLYVISDGGIRISTDNGSTFKDISKGISAISSYQWAQSPVDGSYMVTGLQDIGNYVRRGGNWYTTAGGDGYGGFVDVSDKTIMYFTQGGTRRSAVGDFYTPGNYTTVNSDEVRYMSQSTTDANKMIGAGASGLYYSTNRGQSWTVATGATGTGISVCLSPANAQIAWGVAGNTLYKSTNGGTSWSAVAGVSGTISDVVCDAKDANVAWATSTGAGVTTKVYKTTDGSTWTNYTGSATLSGQSARHVANDPSGASGAVYLGTQTGVFYRDNSMNDWINWSAGLPWTQIQEMSVHNPDRKVRIATWGRGIWESPVYDAGATSSSSGTLSSSSIALSSSILTSSSSVVSSSSVNSSSSATGVDCSTYSAWQNRSYDWVASKEYVTWTSKLWSHTDWVGGEPGKDVLWKFENDCQASSSSSVGSSSSILSSSSSVLSSSSIISSSSQVVANRSYQVLMNQDAGMIIVKSSDVSTQVRLLTAKGEHIALYPENSEWRIDLRLLRSGNYQLVVEEKGTRHVQQIVVRP